MNEVSNQWISVEGDGAFGSEIAKLVAEENNRLLVLRTRSEVVLQILFRFMELGILAPTEGSVTSRLIDAIWPANVTPLPVVQTVTNHLVYDCDIDQAVVSMKAVRRKAKNHIPLLGGRANHGFADRERQTTIDDTGGSTIVSRELVDVSLHRVALLFDT
jgi:hypothetical protein